MHHLLTSGDGRHAEIGYLHQPPCLEKTWHNASCKTSSILCFGFCFKQCYFFWKTKIFGRRTFAKTWKQPKFSESTNDVFNFFDDSYLKEKWKQWVFLKCVWQEILEGFQEMEFWYVEQGSMSGNSSRPGSFRRIVQPLQRQEEKWWLPVPCVPSGGLSEKSRKHLRHKRDCAKQIQKAAMAINGSVLAEMEIPDTYLASLPKVSPPCWLYKTISFLNFNFLFWSVWIPTLFSIFCNRILKTNDFQKHQMVYYE